MAKTDKQKALDDKKKKRDKIVNDKKIVTKDEKA